MKYENIVLKGAPDMVGKNIKTYLKENGIKQNYVAQKIGVPATTLNSMLLEKQKLPVDIYFSVCAVLGEPVTRFAPQQAEGKG